MNGEIYLDNIVYSIQKYGGASTYWREIQKYLIKKDNVIIVSQNKVNEPIVAYDGSTYDINLNKNKFLLELLFPPSLLRYLPLTKRLPENSLYHSSYYRTCLQKNVINIFTVHDFTHNKGLASKFPRKLIHMGFTALGLRNADGIICISENTKKDLMHYFPSIPEHKIKVIYHGINDDFFPVEKTNAGYLRNVALNQPYVIFIGKRVGYKRFDIVIEAVKSANMNLVIVGGGALTSTEQFQLNQNVKGCYFKLDNLNNSDLNVLYNHAYALVYPSLYEGFGIPVVEAMRAGCPVISTNRSSIPEIAGDAALLMSEVTSECILEKIKLLQNTDLRNDLREKGFAQSKKFTWEKCFLETYEFYQQIYKAKTH